jgi:serine/threonine-protein kinase ULK/ATG1
MEDIGPYRINLKKTIGKGACGIVWWGEDRESHTPIAAKQIYFVEDDIQEKQQVQKEVEMLQMCKAHPNVLQILYHEAIDNSLWIITEYCDGKDLSNYMYKNRVGLNEKVDIMYQCSSGLSYMHSFKPEAIVHRDIKPDNILVRNDKDKCIIKLADFGIAKLFHGQTRGAMSTIAGAHLYMAPEMFTVHQQYDTLVDVFSLGVVFLHLLQANLYWEKNLLFMIMSLLLHMI